MAKIKDISPPNKEVQRQRFSFPKVGSTSGLFKDAKMDRSIFDYSTPTLTDNGKPAARRGRKANGSCCNRTAGLPRRTGMMTMKATRIAFAMLIVGLVAVGGSAVNAFHHGGVAECIGCHSMHDPLGGYLTVGSDSSSTCLTCHEGTSLRSYRVSTAPSAMPAGTAPLQRNPGGDFGWVKKTYTWVVRGSTAAEAGQTHGHNIVATDFGYVADTDNTVAPGGGSLLAEDLSCTSCHDPHGKLRRLEDGTIDNTGAPIIDSGSYAGSPDPGVGEAVGVYRLLAGQGYGEFAGAQDPPAAVAPNTYNQSEQDDQVRVAYGAGMSDWCATCHPDMHVGGPNTVHPIDDTLGTAIADNYDDYVGSGDASGVHATSFLSLVPFGEDTVDYTALKALAKSDDSDLNGPSANSMVTCMSCHRAHASGFEYALRWNPESELLTYAGLWPSTTNGSPPQYARGRAEGEMQAAYYDRLPSTFATYQRSLCNKCHIQD